MLNLSELLTTYSHTLASPAYLVPDIGAMLANIVPDWQEIFNQLDEQDRSALVTLGKHGWYLDPEFTTPQLFSFAEALEEGRVSEVNEVLCDWYDERLQQIELDLSVRHPHRDRFLRFAFQTHRKREYAGSVPMFLREAEGICRELTGYQLYSRSEGVPVLAKLLSLESLTSVRRSAVHALGQPLPISASSRERASAPDLLNRHAVLHGEDLNYDTRIQSCRAISLLNCVSWVFDKLPTESTLPKEEMLSESMSPKVD